jgi:signal transduction histidine kinase
MGSFAPRCTTISASPGGFGRKAVRSTVLAGDDSMMRRCGLVMELREAGLSVELVAEGEPRPRPAGVAVSAYRIVQKALTNTLKHSTADKAR